MGRRKKVRFALSASVLALLTAMLAGCGGSPSATPAGDTSAAERTASSEASGSSTTSEESALHTPEYKLSGNEVAVIKTSKGTIKVKFFSDAAPVASANFVELALKGYYNGIRFHRYVPNFVIQGGDPQTKGASAQDVASADASQRGPYGTGGPGYTIKDEYAGNPNKHVVGSLAMARTGMPNSGGSQFYFALEPLPSLDGQYTVFGQATDGVDVIKQLRAGDEIESITVENASK